jgi:hypothetical protein
MQKKIVEEVRLFLRKFVIFFKSIKEVFGERSAK